MMQNTYTPEEPNTQQTEMQEAAPSKKTAKRRRHKHDYQYWLAEPYNTARGEMALPALFHGVQKPVKAAVMQNAKRTGRK